MSKVFVKDIVNKEGQAVQLKGWVRTVREHGGVTFVDLEDSTGVVQLVVTEGGGEVFEVLGGLGSQDVIAVTGEVRAREEKYVNPKIETGRWEVGVDEVKVINRSREIPFPLDTDGYEIDEALRLKYRYLDLRRARLRDNLALRNEVTLFVREWMRQRSFLEIETPCISKATPEGSRDFIVPSRLHPGEFYALPQSPQQYKQLLMVAGIERYFQIARVFRDEDPRADRAYGEYTQIDIEQSFVEREDVLNLAEDLIIDLTENVVGKEIKEKPFPRISYAEAMDLYGADRFDMREQADPEVLAFAWVIDFPLFETTETREISSSHHPFTAPHKEDIPLLDEDPMKVRSWQYDLVCNGYEVAGGSVRITDPKLQAQIFQVLGHAPAEIESKFGHLLEAFEYGVPPHGGIALSLERLMMVFAGESTTREVTAFPMTSGGRTAVMEAPSNLAEEQLDELSIKVTASDDESG